MGRAIVFHSTEKICYGKHQLRRYQLEIMQANAYDDMAFLKKQTISTNKSIFIE